jgi:phosphoglycerate dehydrogenase-like enzyme
MTASRLKVVVAGNLPSGLGAATFDEKVEIQPAQTDEELRSAVRGADILYSWQVPEIVPAETPRLRWIQLPSAGADHIRSLPVWNSPITITASQGIHTVPMSEHLFAMILSLTRHIPDLVRAQDRHEWHRPRGSQARLGELRGKTIGIIGWGKIGDGVAHLARAFGMRVIGTRWSVLVPRESGETGVGAFTDPPWLEAEDASPDVVFPPAQLHDVLSESDVVVLILPLTDETRGSFGEAEFRAMKRGALFFNIGRGQVVREDALASALQSGRVAGAGLDVFTQEPLPRSSPLWTMPNVIISPHVGGVSEQTRERAAWFFAVNLTRYLEGRDLLNVVDRKQGY